jgi:putative transposase
LEEAPHFGYRNVYEWIKEIVKVSEKQIRAIMRQYGLRGIFKKLMTTIASKFHKKYPYLLRGYKAQYPNQVWATDITYIKVSGCNVYLCAIIDLYSRKLLSWRLSNTMDKGFCISALEEALAKYGTPAIFNSDQGSQFTSEDFIKVLEGKKVRISMDGKGRALDNIFIERFWNSLKREDIKYKHYDTIPELSRGIELYMKFYNEYRPHQSLERKTPDEFYYEPFSQIQQELAV